MRFQNVFRWIFFGGVLGLAVYGYHLSDEVSVLRQALQELRSTHLRQRVEAPSENRLEEKQVHLHEQHKSGAAAGSGGTVTPGLNEAEKPDLDEALTRYEEVLEEAAEEEVFVLEETLIALDSSFNNDDVDVSWARSRSLEIQEAVLPMLSIDSEIESVQCRSRICRIETVHKNEFAYREFARQVAASSVCSQCFYTNTGITSKGELIMSLYAAREGVPLPLGNSVM